MEQAQEKNIYQAGLFENRLRKKYRQLRRWARKNRISCYRLYDRDIPELPLSLDLYEFLPSDVSTVTEAARFVSAQNERLSAGDLAAENDAKERTFCVLYLYERPYEKSAEDEAVWLELMAATAAGVLGISMTHVITKQRRHQSHKGGEDGKNQYEKNDGRDAVTGLVQEQGQLFRLDLTSYLDTGLFFDHRPLRALLRDSCAKKSVLNLFCYTAGFSVYAAQGNARRVESVDLSNTYLSWAKENLRLNGFTDRARYTCTRSDCLRFLKEKAADIEKTPEARYDIIILDPPTFSNSKSTQTVLDINRQWPALVEDCLRLLAPGGTLYFSTNSERLKFDAALIPPAKKDGHAISIQDITAQTIPQDFAGSRPHRCWKITSGT